MTPAARLHLTLDLLTAIEQDSRPADAALSAAFRSQRALRDAERAEIADRLYDVLRHRARLDAWLARTGRAATPRHRLLAWLALGEGLGKARIAALLDADRGGRGRPRPGTLRLTSDEAALLARLQGAALDDRTLPEEVRLECPAWAVEPLRRRFGADFAAEMAALLAPPPLDLRIHPLRITRDAALAALRAQGHAAQPCPFSPLGVRLPTRPSLAALPLLAAGDVEIQDEGSQLVAALVDAQPGERVVDFCAGAGGKTLAMASQMANKGMVIACDVSEGRLKRAAQRLRTAGLHNVQTRVLQGQRDPWVKRHKGGFDRVLVDAPCSGTGTWRRNPDARWRDGGAGLETLTALQADILDSAARLVKPGGRLVYATCSLLPQENEAQVEAFLATHPEFLVVPVGDVAPQITDSAHPAYLSLTPRRHETDGFFAGVMVRGEGA